MKEIYETITVNYAKFAIISVIKFLIIVGIGVLKGSLTIMILGFDIMFALLPALLIGVIAYEHSNRRLSDMEETREKT